MTDAQSVQQAFAAMDSIMDRIKLTPAEGFALCTVYNKLKVAVDKMASEDTSVPRGASDAQG
jgi:hypothetical protein